MPASLVSHSFLFVTSWSHFGALLRTQVLIGKKENKEVWVLWTLPAWEGKYYLKELCYQSSLEKFPVKDVTTFL